MDASALSETTRRKKAFQTRVFWFLAGSGLNYLLISTPFKLLKAHTDLPTWLIAYCSVGVGATVFFFWNYFVNFRTDARRRDALPRYVGAVVLMLILSSNVLNALKHFNAHMAFSLGRIPLDLDVVATQFFLAGLKFFLYHRWVFPVSKAADPGVPEPHKEHVAESLAAEA